MTARDLRATPLSRVVVLALFVAALLVRIAVPSGWMPVGHGDGFRITICTGAGGESGTLLLAPTGPDAPQDRPHDDHPCPFVGLALAATPLMLPGFAVPPVIALAAGPAFAEATAIGRGLAAPPPPPTGPPLPR